MIISERTPGDIERLRTLARREKNAEQKDRLRAVAHAIAGRETGDIQDAIGRSRGCVNGSTPGPPRPTACARCAGRTCNASSPASSA